MHLTREHELEAPGLAASNIHRLWNLNLILAIKGYGERTVAPIAKVRSAFSAGRAMVLERFLRKIANSSPVKTVECDSG
jgi:hypothetical protein